MVWAGVKCGQKLAKIWLKIASKGQKFLSYLNPGKIGPNFLPKKQKCCPYPSLDTRYTKQFGPMVGRSLGVIETLVKVSWLANPPPIEAQ